MKQDAPITTFRFKFSGKLATKGQLNFYELSRSQYAAARLLYTIARYQETGRVPQRITEKSVADIRAAPPVEGSYIYDALLFLQQNVAQAAIGVPLNALFVMIWDHLFPAADIWLRAQSEAREERRRLQSKSQLALSREETKRLALIKDIEEGKEITKREALKVFQETARDLKDDRLIPDQRKLNLSMTIDDLNLEIQRENAILPHRHLLEALPKDQNQKLFGKARGLVADIGLPLRSSADLLSIGTAESNYISVNSQALSELLELQEPENPEYLKGKLVQYNTENAFGRFRLSDQRAGNFGAQIGFRVEISNRKIVGDKVIDAMKEDEVVGVFYVYRDAEGIPKRMILADLIAGKEAIDIF